LAHRGDLLECGVPVDVTSSDRRWGYTLLHGDDPSTGWNDTWLTDEQATRLLELLEPAIPSPVGIWLIENLQRRLRNRE
jgi:hypothetical protein